MLNSLFNPSSVAVIGAARDPMKVGHSVLSNLLSSGYAGHVHPVNPSAHSILKRKCYPDLKSIPGAVDLAVICVPRGAVLESIRQCGEKGVGGAVVITSGFKETGEEGHVLEDRLVEEASRHGVRVLGPNCLGLINTANGLNASFAPTMPKKGGIAFFSQSGALCTAILDWSLVRGIGFSKFVSLGNKADINELDLLEYLADDPDTKVVLGYMEGLSSGREFMEKAWNTVGKTPLIIAKAGGTAAGARAASSHTGSLAGSERAFEAAFRQTGVLRADTIEDLFNYALAFSTSPTPKGSALAVVTNAGGPGIIAADACERSAAKMAELSASTVARLKEALPPQAGFFNPVDVIGDAPPERYEAALDAVLDDPAVDGALVLLTPQAMTDAEGTARAVLDVRSRYDKPVLSCFMGGAGVKKGADMLTAGGAAVYPYPEDGVRAFEALVRYNRARGRKRPEPVRYDADTEGVRRIIGMARASGRKELGENEARGVIAAYGFRTPAGTLAHTSSEAVAAARKTGYPVVLKIASPDILHKTDVGGVKVGLTTDREVESAFLEVTSNARRLMPRAMVMGAMVQEMVSGGREVILGMSADPQFGPLVMFGLGGIYVEALGDVSFRVAPIGEADAAEMVSEVKASKILKGLRGERPSDMAAVYGCITRLSQLVCDFPEIVEMDINPLVVKEEGEGAVAIDARITLT